MVYHMFQWFKSLIKTKVLFSCTFPTDISQSCQRIIWNSCLVFYTKLLLCYSLLSNWHVYSKFFALWKKPFQLSNIYLPFQNVHINMTTETLTHSPLFTDRRVCLLTKCKLFSDLHIISCLFICLFFLVSVGRFWRVSFLPSKVPVQQGR